MSSTFTILFSYIPNLFKYIYIFIILVVVSYISSYYFWVVNGEKLNLRTQIELNIYPVADNEINISEQINELNLLNSYVKASKNINDINDMNLDPIIISGNDFFEKFSYYFNQKKSLRESVSNYYVHMTKFGTNYM